MVRKNIVPALALLLTAISMTACGGKADFSDIKAQMKAIQDKPQGKIAPVPDFKSVETFAYEANRLRSPFIAPAGFAQMQSEEANNSVKPNITRSKEYLEGFNLDGLTMVGSIQRPGAPLQALILDTSGRVTRVSVGSHLGKNFGRITKVTNDGVALVEIIPDGKRGWSERPRRMELNRAGASQ